MNYLEELSRARRALAAVSRQIELHRESVAEEPTNRDAAWMDGVAKSLERLEDSMFTSNRTALDAQKSPSQPEG